MTVPPVHARDVGVATTAGSAAGRLPTKPGAVPDAGPEPMAQPGASIPDERGAPRRNSSSVVEDRPASNGIRRALVATDMTADQDAFRRAARAGDDRHPIAHDTRAAEPGLSHPRYAAARSTRLVTGLSELNNLFRSVIDSQSDDGWRRKRRVRAAQDNRKRRDRPRRTNTPVTQRDRPTEHEVIPPDAAARWSAPRTDHAHETSFAAPASIRAGLDAGRDPRSASARRHARIRPRPDRHAHRVICRRRVHAARPDARGCPARSSAGPVRGALARAGDPSPRLHRRPDLKCRWKSPEWNWTSS